MRNVLVLLRATACKPEVQTRIYFSSGNCMSHMIKLRGLEPLSLQVLPTSYGKYPGETVDADSVTAMAGSVAQARLTLMPTLSAIHSTIFWLKIVLREFEVTTGNYILRNTFLLPLLTPCLLLALPLRSFSPKSPSRSSSPLSRPAANDTTPGRFTFVFLGG